MTDLLMDASADWLLGPGTEQPSRMVYDDSRRHNIGSPAFPKEI